MTTMTATVVLRQGTLVAIPDVGINLDLCIKTKSGEFAVAQHSKGSYALFCDGVETNVAG